MPFFIAFILPKVNDQPAIETGRFVLNIHCSKTLQIATIKLPYLKIVINFSPLKTTFSLTYF